jgi:hypothetical protein
MVSTAYADPITPSYSVADLGTGPIMATTANGHRIAMEPGTLGGGPYPGSSGGNQMLSAEATGSQIVAVSNGQATYPFTLTPATPLQPDHGIMVNFPLAQPAPVNDMTYGDPRNAYSIVLNPIMNASGIVAAIDAAGVSGHDRGGDVAYYVQRNPDGSWGSPVWMWGGSQAVTGGYIGGASLTGINPLNQVLGSMQPVSFHNAPTQAVLYDISTHSLINLSDYLAPQGYHDIHPLALDDQGRILLWAAKGWSAEDTLLLTPDGVSSDPIPLATPEPGSLAVMALAMAAFVARRVRKTRRERQARRDPDRLLQRDQDRRFDRPHTLGESGEGRRPAPRFAAPSRPRGPLSHPRVEIMTETQILTGIIVLLAVLFLAEAMRRGLGRALAALAVMGIWLGVTISSIRRSINPRATGVAARDYAIVMSLALIVYFHGNRWIAARSRLPRQQRLDPPLPTHLAQSLDLPSPTDPPCPNTPHASRE